MASLTTKRSRARQHGAVVWGGEYDPVTIATIFEDGLCRQGGAHGTYAIVLQSGAQYTGP